MNNLIQLETIWHRLISCATEQFKVLLTTAFSTVVRESEDCAVGIFDGSGRLMAQAPRGAPGQIHSMATCIDHFLEFIPRDSLEPGDALISNDPWRTAGHLNDITVITPVFHKDKLVAFVGSCAQSVDIGGRGFSADGQSNYEEGLFIPFMKLAVRGELNETLLQIMRHNVRSPDLVLGDLFAQVSCNDIASARIRELLDEFDLEGFEAISDEILVRSEKVIREAISKIPNGRYETKVVTDGFDEPIVIQCAVEIKDDSIVVDYAGSSSTVPWGINVPLCYTKSYTIYALKCLLAPSIPNNGGTFRAVTVTAPEGSIMNAQHPAPVAGRHLIGTFQPLVVFAALQSALPETVIAGSSVLWITTLQSEKNGAAQTTTFFASGGVGARHDKPGLSATGFPGNIAMTPVEMLESTSPVLVRSKALRLDSAGPGKQRGGLGQDFTFTVRGEGPFTVNTMSDQTMNSPPGVAGGESGAPGVYHINGKPLGVAKSRCRIKPMDEVLMRLPGGGGYGDPMEREASAVLEDVRNGYLSHEAARDKYGVAIVVTPDGEFVVDEQETQLLRAGKALCDDEVRQMARSQ